MTHQNRRPTYDLKELMTSLVDSQLTLDTLVTLATQTPDPVGAEGTKRFLKVKYKTRILSVKFKI